MADSPAMVGLGVCSLVVALDVVHLFANDWAALLETKGRLQVGRLLQTSVFVASSTRRDEALVQCWQNLPDGLDLPVTEFAWDRATRDIADATVRKEVRQGMAPKVDLQVPRRLLPVLKWRRVRQS